MLSETEARKILCDYSRRTAAARLVTSTDGNLSLRLGDDRLLITPSGVPKSEVTEEQLVLVDPQGNPLSGEKRKPSSEGKLHYEVYARRSDTHAVIHAHPPRTIAYSLAGVPLDSCLMPEYALVLGQTPTAPYGTPGTDEVSDSIRDLIERSDAIILERHGTLTVGATMEEAFMLLERMEMSAEVGLYTRMLKEPLPYPAGKLEALETLRNARALPQKTMSCPKGGVCACSGGGVKPPSTSDITGSCLPPLEKRSEERYPVSGKDMLDRVMRNIQKDGIT